MREREGEIMYKFAQDKLSSLKHVAHYGMCYQHYILCFGVSVWCLLLGYKTSSKNVVLSLNSYSECN